MIKQHGSDPATQHAELTADGNPLDPIPRALYAKTDGNIEIIDSEEVSVVYPVTAGSVIPFRAYALGPGTTATVIGWW